MFIAIDKATALRMYDKVRRAWDAEIAMREAALASAPPDRREALAAVVAFMRETGMALIVSQAQNEIADMAEKGLDIRPHRERMLREKLDERFKNGDDPLRLVFVCAMWITGFDVPTCSTIYLDKPMKNHTLMQTIARANRNAPGKKAGLIVDYVGVFRNLERALAIYAIGGSTSTRPIRDKSALADELATAIELALVSAARAGSNPAPSSKLPASSGWRGSVMRSRRSTAPIPNAAPFSPLHRTFWSTFKAVFRPPRRTLPHDFGSDRGHRRAHRAHWPSDPIFPDRFPHRGAAR